VGDIKEIPQTRDSVGCAQEGMCSPSSFLPSPHPRYRRQDMGRGREREVHSNLGLDYSTYVAPGTESRGNATLQ
jgi:hypothetical protein